jgi:diguanylate cyclase (GGDEF)-like protein
VNSPRPSPRTEHDYSSARSTLALSLCPVRVLLSLVFLVVVLGTPGESAFSLDRGTSLILAAAACANAVYNTAKMLGLAGEGTGRSIVTLQMLTDALLALAGMLLLDASATPLAWIALLLPVFDAGVAFGALGAGLAWVSLSVVYIVLKLEIEPAGQSDANMLGLAVQQLAAVAVVVIPTAYVAARMRDDLAHAHGDRVDANRRSEDLLLVAAAARRLATTKDSLEVTEIALDSAVQLGFARAEMCEKDGNRGWRLLRATGTLGTPGPTLDGRLDEALERNGPVTIGIGGRADAEELRMLGYGSGVVLPVAQGSERAIVMRAWSTGELAADANALESVELLATLTSGAWQSAETFADLESWSTQLEYRASHDELTGLANRASLIASVEASLRIMREAGPQFAVLFLDLDGFKGVNDTLGHEAGDAVLQGIARRLGNHVRGHDVLARLGGDEFVIVLNDLSDPDDALIVAERICESAAAPFSIGGSTVSLGASIGITHAGPGDSTETLLNTADHFMYQAKRMGGGRVVVNRPATT